MKDEEIARLKRENESLHDKSAVEKPQTAAAPTSPKQHVASKDTLEVVSQSFRITKQLVC